MTSRPIAGIALVLLHVGHSWDLHKTLDYETMVNDDKPFGWKKKSNTKVDKNIRSVCWIDFNMVIKENIKNMGWEMYWRECKENIQREAGRNSKDTNINIRNLRAS